MICVRVVGGLEIFNLFSSFFSLLAHKWFRFGKLIESTYNPETTRTSSSIKSNNDEINGTSVGVFRKTNLFRSFKS